MNRYLFILLSLVFLASACKTPEARKPIKTSSGSYIDYSVEKNKKMIADEENDILEIIEKDSLNDYINSEQGFWYYFNNQTSSETEKADFGDLIEFEYDVKDLSGKTIYSKEELGPQKYYTDREELISGLRDGLKLLKEGETATFLFPSHKAYGYYGDLKKIGTNMPIISTVTILNIEQIN
ncbi:MAG: gliding motility-associated peptidyl-prolyl isomerase GldI [Flavobacteriaceae bacterium]